MRRVWVTQARPARDSRGSTGSIVAALRLNHRIVTSLLLRSPPPGAVETISGCRGGLDSGEMTITQAEQDQEAWGRRAYVDEFASALDRCERFCKRTLSTREAKSFAPILRAQIQGWAHAWTSEVAISSEERWRRHAVWDVLRALEGWDIARLRTPRSRARARRACRMARSGGRSEARLHARPRF